MMSHVVDFLGYMFFSSLEYFAMYLLILSVFNIHPSWVKREIIIIVMSSTLISYLLVIADVYQYVPAFFVSPAIVYLMLRFFIIRKVDRIRKKFFYTVFVSVAGIFTYALIQFGLVQLLMTYDFLKISDLSNSFSSKTYITQSFTATIMSIISGYLLYFKGGFGFIFKSGNYKLSTAILLTLLIVVGILFQFFKLENTTSSIFMLVASAICISSIVAYYLSYKQDNREYQ